jgi:hypothetical protein
LVLLAVAAGVAWLGWEREDEPTASARPTRVASAPAAAAPAAAAQVVESRLPGPPPAPADTDVRAGDATRDYAERRDFEVRVQAFPAEAASLDAASRQREAQRLEADIDRYERARHLSAGEALLLRIELLRATITDPLEQADAITTLTERYRAQAERRMREHARQPAPALIAYQDRERAIVAEVMALETIPGGLDRDEYLRRRLQEEREYLYDRLPIP